MNAPAQGRPQPLPDRGRAGDVRDFQINLDGQQVTRDMGTGTQPKYSQDMIAEFQYIEGHAAFWLSRLPANVRVCDRKGRKPETVHDIMPRLHRDCGTGSYGGQRAALPIWSPAGALPRSASPKSWRATRSR